MLKKHFLLIGFEVGTDCPVYISYDTVNRHLLVTGKSGSGKSVSIRGFINRVWKQRSVCVIDPNTHLALDVLDDVISKPAMRRRCLYITTTQRKSVPLIDFMQQSLSETSVDRDRRKQLASYFTTAIIMTASTGGSTAGASFVRLKMNVEMGVRLLLELKAPMAFLPSLFQFQSKLLDALIEKCQDHDVRGHFNNLRAIGNANQFYALTESTITRLNIFFNNAVIEAMFSASSGGISIDELLDRERMILVCDFGVTDNSTVEHSRLIQKILLEAITRAAMKRTEEEAARRPLSIFIDEASTSGLMDLANVEALGVLRKYGASFCYVVQGVAGVENRQPEIRLMDAVLENTSGKIVFGTASDVDAQRFARLSVGGQDFKVIKHKKEFERQRLVGYEQSFRMTVTTNPDGQKSTSVTPIDRPLLESEFDESIDWHSSDEIFHMEAGELLAMPIGEFKYYGPEYPRGVHCYTPAPKTFTTVTKRMRNRRRNEFIQEQLSQFPYRDVDGVRRDFNELLNRFGVKQATPKTDTDTNPNNPFE